MIEKFWSFLILFLAVSWAFESCQSKTIKEEIKVEQRASKLPTIDKDKLVEAFAFVESSNNPKAVNKKSGATGIIQLKPIMVRECNRLLGFNKYKLSDRTNKEKSIEMFHVIMQHKNPDYDIATSCHIWNYKGGFEYYKKVRNKYNELIKED